VLHLQRFFIGNEENEIKGQKEKEKKKGTRPRWEGRESVVAR
jgi:hypothetical protein